MPQRLAVDTSHWHGGLSKIRPSVQRDSQFGTPSTNRRRRPGHLLHLSTRIGGYENSTILPVCNIKRLVCFADRNWTPRTTDVSLPGRAAMRAGTACIAAGGVVSIVADDASCRFRRRGSGFGRLCPSCGRSSPLVPDEAGEVVGEVGHADLGPSAADADRAHEQAHARLLRREDMLDESADL